jgi:hypothetical protein
MIAGAGIAGVGFGAEKAGSALNDQLHKPTHVEQLRTEFDEAKANPSEVQKGKYVWLAVDGGNPTTIARAVAKEGEVDEVIAELQANEVRESVGGVEQDILPTGNVLVEKSRLNLEDPLVLKGTSELETPAPVQQ